MAKNKHGFISKRYPQPYKYERLFNNWCAYYKGEEGRIVIIEACPHIRNWQVFEADIHEYSVQIQGVDNRYQMATCKTQKKAIELMQRYSKVLKKKIS